VKVRLPTGETAYLPGASAEEVTKYEAFLEARFQFAMQYAESQGWGRDVQTLTIKQILEIRNQPGWKTPEGTESATLTVSFVPRTAN